MIKEFQKFIARGNVLDLAVGIIMGAAFTSIVNSLVNDIIMPPIGYALGGVNFADLFIALDGQTYASLEAAKAASAATINYGVFINAIINFLIVAAAVFFLVRGFNALMERVKRGDADKEVEEAAKPVEPTVDEKLLVAVEKLNTLIEQKL
jgi:large conductance mechanosensitive channel